jgi:hypothetical protein
MHLFDKELASIGVPAGTLGEVLSLGSELFVTCAGVNGLPCGSRRPFPVPLIEAGPCAAAGEAAAGSALAWCGECADQKQQQAKAEARTTSALTQRQVTIAAAREAGVVFRLCPFCDEFGAKPVACYHITCPKCDGEWCWICRKRFEGLRAKYEAMMHVAGHVRELNESLQAAFPDYDYRMYDDDDEESVIPCYSIYNFPLLADPGQEEYLGVPICIQLDSQLFVAFAGGRSLKHWEYQLS